MDADRWQGADAATCLQDTTGKLLQEGCLMDVKNDVGAALLDPMSGQVMVATR